MASKLLRTFTLPSNVPHALCSATAGTGINDLKDIIEKALKA